jgi:alpha-glucosidase (family GH31 glycosyl hydrolase)
LVDAREFKPLLGGDYHLTYRLESVDRKEKIYGMGQYQQSFLDLKGLDLEMAQRNSQASVPFMLSSLGYGMLWNNPAVGRAVLGKNIMSFESQSTKVLDYWIVAGDSPARIVEAYADVTGKVPMMPEYGLGFWQCKLRYQTQEELLEVAREYRRRNLPLDVIVVDFFHCRTPPPLPSRGGCLRWDAFFDTDYLCKGRSKENGNLILRIGKIQVSLRLCRLSLLSAWKRNLGSSTSLPLSP